MTKTNRRQKMPLTNFINVYHITQGSEVIAKGRKVCLLKWMSTSVKARLLQGGWPANSSYSTTKHISSDWENGREGGVSIGGIRLYVPVCVFEERVLWGENWQSVKNGVYFFGRSAEGKFSFITERDGRRIVCGSVSACMCLHHTCTCKKCLFGHAYTCMHGSLEPYENTEAMYLSMSMRVVLFMHVWR